MLLSLVPETHGPVGGRGEPHEHRPGQPDDGHRRAAGQRAGAPRPAARAARPTARPPPAPARPAAPRPSWPRTRARRTRPRARASACARPRARARRTTAPPCSRARAARPGCCGATIATVDRRQREHQPGREAGGAAEAPAHEVVEQRRPSPRPSAPAGTSMLQELKPNARTDSACTHSASGGLSTVITPARVERAVQERVPARAHRAHGGAVVLVGQAVAARAPTGTARRRARAARAARARGQRAARARRARRRRLAGRETERSTWLVLSATWTTARVPAVERRPARGGRGRRPSVRSAT